MAKVEKKDDVIIIEAKGDDGPPPEEGLPPWMATFADMVTLLLCFFVLLLSFANQDINNFKTLMGSVQQALGVQVVDKMATEIPYAEMSQEMQEDADKEKTLQKLSLDLNQFVAAAKLKERATASRRRNSIMLRVDSRLLFPPGSSRLLPGAKMILNEVVRTLSTSKLNLMVQGHTDNTETAEVNNWELSATRAAACLRYILAHSDISPSRLKAVGLADSSPLLPNNSEANREVNRRVEFYYQFPDEEGW